jgi:hypothetical protein
VGITRLSNEFRAFGTRSISGTPDPQNPPMSLFLCYYPVLTGIAMDKNTAMLFSESSNSMGPAIWVAGMHLELQQRCQRLSLSAGIQDAVSLAELSWLAREHSGMREQRNFQPSSDRSGKKKTVDNNNRTCIQCIQCIPSIWSLLHIILQKIQDFKPFIGVPPCVAAFWRQRPISDPQNSSMFRPKKWDLTYTTKSDM